jgi:anti-sigma-K factor RskA
VAALPLSVEQLAPPASLRDRVLAIPTSRRGVIPILPRPARVLPRFTAGPVLRYSWALAAAVLVALGTWNVVLERQLGDTNSRLAGLQNQVLRGALVGNANATVGSVSYLANDHLALVALHSLDVPSGDREYELWVIEKNTPPQPAGVFLPEPDGTKLLVLSRQLTPADTLAVTIERHGGSNAPTMAPIITGHV